MSSVTLFTPVDANYSTQDGYAVQADPGSLYATRREKNIASVQVGISASTWSSENQRQYASLTTTNPSSVKLWWRTPKINQTNVNPIEIPPAIILGAMGCSCGGTVSTPDSGSDQNIGNPYRPRGPCNGSQLETFYIDEDKDGYGRSDRNIEACSNPAGYTKQSGDCNDMDPDINSAAVEICNDQIDNNCNAEKDERPCTNPCDRDSDGHIATSCGGNDCDDSKSSINPGISENDCNGIDDNCNNAIDENKQSHASSRCSNGDVYWYDSCGNKQDAKESCDNNGCQSGMCLEDPNCGQMGRLGISRLGNYHNAVSGFQYQIDDYCVEQFPGKANSSPFGEGTSFYINARSSSPNEYFCAGYPRCSGNGVSTDGIGCNRAQYFAVAELRLNTRKVISVNCGIRGEDNVPAIAIFMGGDRDSCGAVGLSDNFSYQEPVTYDVLPGNPPQHIYFVAGGLVLFRCHVNIPR